MPKSVAQYLTEHGTPELAIAAMHRDFANLETASSSQAESLEKQEKTNLKARRAGRVYKLLAQALDLPEDLTDDTLEAEAKTKAEELAKRVPATAKTLETLTEALRPLGFQPDQDTEKQIKALSKQLEEAEAARKEFAATERRKLVGNVLKASGFDETAAPVLELFLAGLKASDPKFVEPAFSIGKQTVNGKETDVAQVKIGDTVAPFTDWLKADPNRAALGASLKTAILTPSTPQPSTAPAGLPSQAGGQPAAFDRAAAVAQKKTDPNYGPL